MDNGLQSLGRALLVFGAISVVIGGLFLLAGRLPWSGRLPGDIVVQRKNVTFYFPLATSILLSIVVSLIFWIIGRR